MMTSPPFARFACSWPFVGVWALILTACPDTGIVCKAGTKPCGSGCADYTTDSRNCGACGRACGTGQVCQDSACRCQEGTTTCDGSCVMTAYDARNCGACGQRCGDGQVCEEGACKAACLIETSIRCGDSCVNSSTDVNNCGGCAVQCQSGQVCRAQACTFEVVAACLTSGEIVGFKAASGEKGPPADLGTQPQALASMQGRVLSADGTDQRLYQATLSSGDITWKQASRSNRTGSVPNQVLVDGTLVYVANAGSGTLQVLQVNGSVTSDVRIDDAGVAGEVPLVTIAELPLGMNTYPQGMVKVGSSLWVPLYGGYGAEPSLAGQKVLEITVADPRAPSVVNTVDLSTLDLKAFDGGSTAARPWAITTHQGALYVVLNNLEASTYAPAGPGFLARIDPVSRAVTLVDLGADVCLNPQSVAEAASGLVVSCGGLAQYTGPAMALVGAEHSGLVLLDANDRRVAQWSPWACDGDAGCAPMLPGRLAVLNNRVFLADQNAGRILAFDFTDGGLTEERVIQACTVSSTTGVANVSDVLTP